MAKPANTPEPPYYAVIFTSIRTDVDEGYGDMSDRMTALAETQPGFLGIESARDAEGFGLTVSYWDSEESIAKFREIAEHRVAQAYGKQKWYEDFFTRVAKVERVNRFTRSDR